MEDALGLDAANTWSVPEISVVVPLFNEEANLLELHQRLSCALATTERGFELVFVDDGSRDDTGRLLQDLHKLDPRVMVISLSRNFGHQAAISAGIDHARGEAVIVMDGDLQDPPEVLPLFIDTWLQGSKVVFAVRAQRKEGLFKRGCYYLFYRLLRAASDLEIPLDSGDFCLMDRQVVDALKQLPERGRFVRGLRAFVGFKQTGLACERAARQAGKPKYTFGALCRLALDGLIGFSSAPLQLLFHAGGFCLVLALLGGLASLVQAARQESLPGWWIVTLALMGCSGLQLFGMGILGEYIRCILVETKARPSYVVAAVRQPRAGAAWQEAKPHSSVA
jgi:glycosyltransferase involved in cell wall biosynthesis